ncbi:O-antigen biosynthesis glycosyltransferase WbnK [Dyadobacter sp. CECT 9275]|uniref:O-antigen biosynthesis glycosyltransferase WbnK n=1 Tax=Dyadobacter helix TaxID=2822344 RepID=A0A916N623_9BACT|nr:alpha-1,2-fucosyltransferase [Dyadobacter sp. CECT 9275]CAG5007978.1 O-antigen biosynthesis glycosyltransferase WbnK [Dyadobacter sp. CECT 9275]
MITVKLQGGLGNQLFQYATARAVAMKHRTNIAFDITSLYATNTDITPREFELNKLSIEYKSPSIAAKLAYKLVNIPFGNFIQNTLLKFLSARIYTEKSLLYNPFILDQTCKNTYLTGFFQSEKYFNSIKTELLREICWQPEHNHIVNVIKNTNSVSLHIRRGDYAANYKTQKFHGLLPLEYYNNAIKYITDRISDIHIFVFSDDINWSKQHLNFKGKLTFVEENSASESYKDLQLMSLCKHNIIANSSFSWWGAWLNQHTNKIVVAPKRWFADTTAQEQSHDIVPKEWIRL